MKSDREVSVEDRREFLRKATATAVAAPAVALLLSANAKPVAADVIYRPQPPIIDTIPDDV